jgi:hypothetical protein
MVDSSVNAWDRRLPRDSEAGRSGCVVVSVGVDSPALGPVLGDFRLLGPPADSGSAEC